MTTLHEAAMDIALTQAPAKPATDEAREQLPSLEYMRGYLRHYDDGRPVLDGVALAWLDALIDEVEQLRALADGRAQMAATDGLSSREATVARYLRGPMTYGEIANELYVSVNTIKTQVKNIYRKLGVEGRNELRALYRKTPTA